MAFTLFDANSFGILPGALNNSAAPNFRGALYVWEFTTTRQIYLEFVVPRGYVTGTTLNLVIRWAAGTATSGNCSWDCRLAIVGGSFDIDNALSFGTASSVVSTAAPGTAGQTTTTTLVLSGSALNSIAAGDTVVLRVDRASSGDTMPGVAQIISVELVEP